MSRNWKDNAHEFGALTRQGYGVRLGLLVACSVESIGQGKSKPALSVKSSIAEFASESGVSTSTVRSYIDKWDRMASEKGWTGIDRADLSPEDVDTWEMPEGFTEDFDSLATSGGSGLTGKVRDIAQNTNAMAEAIKADPKVRKAALDAVIEGEKINPTPPTTPEGKAFRAKVASVNASSTEIAKRVLLAASELAKAQEAWDANIADLAPSEVEWVRDALRECVVIAETLRASLEMDEVTR